MDFPVKEMAQAWEAYTANSQVIKKAHKCGRHSECPDRLHLESANKNILQQ
jgi:hypothetical protein